MTILRNYLDLTYSIDAWLWSKEWMDPNKKYISISESKFDKFKSDLIVYVEDFLTSVNINGKLSITELYNHIQKIDEAISINVKNNKSYINTISYRYKHETFHINSYNNEVYQLTTNENE